MRIPAISHTLAIMSRVFSGGSSLQGSVVQKPQAPAEAEKPENSSARTTAAVEYVDRTPHPGDHVQSLLGRELLDDFLRALVHDFDGDAVGILMETKYRLGIGNFL